MTTWIKMTFAPGRSEIPEDYQEALSCELVAHGALGSTLEADGRVTCFCEPDSSIITALALVGEQWGFNQVAQEALPQENWNRQCPEVWQPFVRGLLTVVPVESIHDDTPLPDRHIKIIPGLGFGTGHHPTTNMILGVLSTLAQKGHTAHSVFDLGTGSGILAIAAAKLFDTTVVANDIDPHAIANADENSLLNKTTHLINNTTAPIQEITGSFDLIIANVYGEVLVELTAEITRLASFNCTLILSGISELVRDMVIASYTAASLWTLDEELSEGGWICLTLKRR
jgi:ribosomal protein L11 methyltransferase